jgi:hypothetical protein
MLEYRASLFIPTGKYQKNPNQELSVEADKNSY